MGRAIFFKRAENIRILPLELKLEELKKMLETYKQAYIKCMGAIEFLENKKKDEEKDK